MDSRDIPLEDTLVFNGIDAARGTYLFRPISTGEVITAAQRAPADREHQRDLERRLKQAGSQVRGVKEGVDPKNLAQAGWGIVFALEDQQRIPAWKEALGELLALRREQAGERYREYSGPDAYRPGETKSEFLARHGVGPGPADPDKVPYYLLIAADPETIPYTFQYQLDVQYAVGRIYFDHLEEYAQYARSLVAVETGRAYSARRATFFGVQNEADQATRLSSTQLVQPLAARLQELQQQAGWQVETLLAAGATKSALADRLHSSLPPGLLFTASHGVGFPKEDSRQLPQQGALLCQDWPGPLQWKGPLPQDFYFAGDDLTASAHLAGSLAFHFACYGAGTPREEEYLRLSSRDAADLAPHAFLARLPQRLLGHPREGMLAVIGHVDRAWGYSFRWEKADSQLAVFESTLLRIMKGEPVGYALEYFNQRYAELSTLLSSELQGARFGKQVDELALAGMWTANNDARSYVILGDPAARLVFASQASGQENLSSASISFSAVSSLDSFLPEPAKEIDQLVRVIASSAQSSDQERAERLFQLGLSLSALQGAERQSFAQAAAAASQAAGKSFTFERDGKRWLDLHLHLADLFAELYAWTGDRDSAQSAERACRAVIATPGVDQESLTGAHLHLADLLSQLSRQDQTGQVAAQAIASYQEALNGLSQEETPFLWAKAHLSLARLETRLYQERQAEFHRAEARQHLEACLKVFDQENFPSFYASIQELLLVNTGKEDSETPTPV